MPTPSIAHALRLKPQTRVILLHLLEGRSISPLEAWGVYGNSRLAAAIHDIRKSGYVVVREHKRDPMGHHYSRYWLMR